MPKFVIDSLEQDSFLVGDVVSLPDAAKLLSQFCAEEDKSSQEAAELLQRVGFLEVDVDGLPSGEIVLCRLREPGNNGGVFQIDSELVVKNEVDLPAKPQWSIHEFINQLPHKGCEDPTCECGLGDCCGC